MRTPKRWTHLLACIALAACFAGCDDAALIRKFMPVRDGPAARRYLDLLMAGKVEEIQKDLDSGIVDLDPREKLQQAADELPAETPKSVKVVGVRTFADGEKTDTEITYECEFTDAWYAVTIDLRKRENTSTVFGLHVNRLAEPLEILNRFTFTEKGPAQYFVFLLSLLSLGISFYTFRLCIKSKTGMSRWMWASFILAGVGRIAVNWTTGQIGMTILAISVPTASMIKAPYGPWILSVYLPAGALFFLNEQWREKVMGKSFDLPAKSPDSTTSKIYT